MSGLGDVVDGQLRVAGETEAVPDHGGEVGGGVHEVDADDERRGATDGRVAGVGADALDEDEEGAIGEVLVVRWDGLDTERVGECAEGLAFVENLADAVFAEGERVEIIGCGFGGAYIRRGAGFEEKRQNVRMPGEDGALHRRDAEYAG